MANTFYPLVVHEITRETSDTVSVSFRLSEEQREIFSYTSGQYLTFKRVFDGDEIRRSYSLCSSPHEQLWTVAIKRVDSGLFSTYANISLKKGDTLEVMPPQGNFLLPAEQTSEKLLFFAAGSGITPIISQIKTVLSTRKEDVILFYGNKNTESIIFREELEGLKNEYMGRVSIHYILSKEHPGSDLFYGRLDTKKCNEYAKYFFKMNEIGAAYLCGPAEMIFEIKDSLISYGLDPEKIHFELFHAPGENILSKKKEENPNYDSTKVSLVTLRLDGITFDFPLPYGGQNILDAALQNGADLPYACKGGVCSTCKAKLTAGEVSMDVNYALEPSEVAAGYILTCQSHPRSTVISVDFDS